MFHTVLEKYLLSLSEIAGCDVVLVPALGLGSDAARLDVGNILERLDGLLLTGARSMVDPDAYGAGALADDMALDRYRDATTFPLVLEAVKRGVPLLGICRGFQELCCALGGTLIPDLDKWRSEVSHRAPEGVSYEDKYLPAHPVQCVPGGLLDQWAREAELPADCIQVNSLHRQGVATLGVNLRVEARSMDGLIEAASISEPGQFAIGVQWHPEWYLSQHGLNRAIFAFFGAACSAKAQRA